MVSSCARYPNKNKNKGGKKSRLILRTSSGEHGPRTTEIMFCQGVLESINSNLRFAHQRTVDLGDMSLLCSLCDDEWIKVMCWQSLCELSTYFCPCWQATRLWENLNLSDIVLLVSRHLASTHPLLIFPISFFLFVLFLKQSLVEHPQYIGTSDFRAGSCVISRSNYEMRMTYIASLVINVTDSN